jgi:hypothetical protein
MKHVCHAEGCEREVPPKLLMCFVHWKNQLLDRRQP